MLESFFHLSAKEQEEALQVRHRPLADLPTSWRKISGSFGHFQLCLRLRLAPIWRSRATLLSQKHTVRNAPDGLDAIPPSRSQEKKWSDEIRKELLPAWLRDSAHPIVQAGLTGLPAATSRVTDGCIFIAAITVSRKYSWSIMERNSAASISRRSWQDTNASRRAGRLQKHALVELSSAYSVLATLSSSTT
jgi:hypothetical protein